LRAILVRLILIALAFWGNAGESRTYSLVKADVCLQRLSGDDKSVGSSILSAIAPSTPEIPVKGLFSVDKAKRGQVIRAAILMDIPKGLHVNANRPLNKFAIATVARIVPPRGLTVGPIAYPGATVRRLKAVNNERLGVYEGRTVLRFELTVSATFPESETEVKAWVKFQSCSDDVCFPPQTREIAMPLKVVGVGDRVEQINGDIFRARRRK